MAVPIKLVFYALERDTANRAAESVFQRLKQLNGELSDYDPESELRRLCDTAGEGKAVPVSDDLWRVLVHAQALSERSHGAFDVSIGPVIRVWRLARQFKKLPPQELLDRTRQLVGYKAVHLVPEKRAVELAKRGMRLDLGGIAKGFALDEALLALRKHGITRAMIHAGGDIVLGDPPPEKPGWTIGVAPREPKGPPAFHLSLSRCGVATSGDMWQYVELGGKRYSHIVDPRTGLGLTDHCSVTVVAPDGITADGLSTAVSVLGPAKGLELVDQTPGASAYLVRAPEGRTETHQSSRWKDLPGSGPEAGR
jgi:thiamine biosynthesis lipoprotein